MSRTDHRITADERSAFKRCRRQWDFGSHHRRGLEPDCAHEVALAQATKDALAVYYYPGMWDWPSAIVLPLVHKGFLRSIGERSPSVEAGGRLLERYFDWAPVIDDFAPIRIDHDVEGFVPDPREPDRGLVTPDGRRVIYSGRVDLLAVDSADAYWVVRHQIVEEWQDVEPLLLDEESLAACWAWEQAYPGMEITGTIHNEVRLSTSAERHVPRPEKRSSIAQNEPSGGGRSIPQHRRLHGRAHEPESPERVEQKTAGPLRRTRIRRTREEITRTGLLIGSEALEMVEPTLALHPDPGAHCTRCPFLAPCVVMFRGDDPAPVLANGYRRRPVDTVPKPRLGATTWGMGRGAAPPWTT
jgi:hypothetical protein